MTGICLLCGFTTLDLDILDAHVARHEWTSHRRARSIWPSYGHCPTCGATPGAPCITYPGGHVAMEPHADRDRPHARDVA